jgi:hypothetical protein
MNTLMKKFYVPQDKNLVRISPRSALEEALKEGGQGNAPGSYRDRGR